MKKDKKTFKEIRNKMLQNLEKNEMTRMELSKIIKSDYRTIGRHLIWLLGEEKIKKVEKDKKVYYKLL